MNAAGTLNKRTLVRWGMDGSYQMHKENRSPPETGQPNLTRLIAFWETQLYDGNTISHRLFCPCFHVVGHNNARIQDNGGTTLHIIYNIFPSDPQTHFASA